MLTENLIIIGLILENDTCYIRVGKVVGETVYLEKLVKKEDKLVWTTCSKHEFLSKKLTILAKIPNKIECETEELPVYMTKKRYEELLKNKGCTAVLSSNNSVFEDYILLTTLRSKVEREYEYDWDNGKWELV